MVSLEQKITNSNDSGLDSFQIWYKADLYIQGQSNSYEVHLTIFYLEISIKNGLFPIVLTAALRLK